MLVELLDPAVNTLVELEALAIGTVVVDRDGDEWRLKATDTWIDATASDDDNPAVFSHSSLWEYAPISIVKRPEWTP